MSRGERTPEQHRPYVDLVDRVAVTRANDRAAYNRIRARLDELRAWFVERPGWQLIDSHGVARLVKTPARAGSGQGIAPLQSPLDYELMAWVLWFSEKTEAEQFILSHLVEEIPLQATDEAGAARLDWKQRSHRESLERAINALEAMEALRTVNGDLETWVRSGEGDTLYEFTGVAQHLHIHLPDALYDALVLEGDPRALVRGESTASERERVYRTLLLSPALHAADDPEAFAWLRRRDRRESVARDFAQHFGWELEMTNGYAALLRPIADAVSRRVFPARSALSHAVLLLSQHLREQVTAGRMAIDEHERITLPAAAFETHALQVRNRWGDNWSAELRGMKPQALATALLDEMRDWDMVQGPDRDDYVTVMPLAARFSGVYREHGEGMDVRED